MSEVERLVERLLELDAQDQGAHYGATYGRSVFAEAAATITRLSAALERIGLLAERDDMPLRDRTALAGEIAMTALTQGESSRGKL